MDLQLTRKVANITDASRGIGRAIAETLKFGANAILRDEPANDLAGAAVPRQLE